MPRLDLRAALAPSSGISRLLAWVILAVLAALLWAGLVRPLVGLIRGDSDLVGLARDLAQQRRIAERRPGLQAALASLQQAGPVVADFLPGATPALAAALLQGRLTTLTQSLGGSVNSIEALPLADDEGFHRAGLRLKLALRQDSLAPLLYAIDSDQPRLLLLSLSVKSDGEGGLTVVLELAGYLGQGAA
jgi:hypothetical protein